MSLVGGVAGLLGRVRAGREGAAGEAGVGARVAAAFAARAACARIVRVGPGRLGACADAAALAGALLYVDGLSGFPRRRARELDAVARALAHARAGLLALDARRGGTPAALRAALAAAGVRASAVGWAPGDAPVLLAVLDGAGTPAASPAPPRFRVVAILKTYNEADVIGAVLAHLAREGVDAYVIDNWSTDGTWELVRRRLGREVAGCERFPDAPSARASWRALLQRTATVAATLDADWFLHHDADELRSSPWAGVSLRDALHRVEQAGWNAVDHTVVEFHPVDDGFVPGSDVAAHFRHFDLPRRPGALHQVKAWKRTATRVALDTSAGHEVDFPDRRVFPLRFLVRHYPIRSQAHGRRKVLTERRARWDADERAAGWHAHYDHVGDAHVFLRDARTLHVLDDGFDERFLVERLFGVGVADG